MQRPLQRLALGVEFTGDLSVGTKTKPMLYKVAKVKVDKSTEYPIEDCRIDKMEDGWYWVSFIEPGLYRSFLFHYQTIIYKLDTYLLKVPHAFKVTNIKEIVLATQYILCIVCIVNQSLFILSSKCKRIAYRLFII